MERRKFEEDFSRAFEDAEVSPDPKVWTNIELELEKAEGSKMKRRILFYQLLAAASVSFAMIVAGVGYYTLNTRTASDNAVAVNADNAQNAPGTDGTRAAGERSTAGTGLAPAQPPLSQDQPDVTGGEPQTSGEPADATQSRASSSGSRAVERAGALPAGSTAIAVRVSTAAPAERNEVIGEETVSRPDRIVAGNESFAYLPDDASGLPALYEAREPRLAFDSPAGPENFADPVQVMFQRLRDLEEELAGRNDSRGKEGSAENLWTSVGFAAGGFNSVNPSVSSATTMSLQSTNSMDNQTKASGTAYSAGVSVGTRIARRWTLQGGVNYLTQMSSYTADVAVGTPDFQNFKAASVTEFADGRSADAKVIPTAPYSVYSNMEMLTVPVQAGYIIIDRKLSWQVNAGVASDLFLQNTIDPEGDRIEKTTQGPGEESPYRAFNVSGLLGTELSYRFSRHYRLSLNPGLRYPLNSIYKNSTGVESTPLLFDVGLRFRYIFR